MAKKNKGNPPALNYFLSIVFILFLVMVLVLMSLISRIVLSDVNPIGEHVKQTKDLLKDIDEVQKVAEKQIEEKQNETIIRTDIESLSNLNSLEAQVIDINHRNVNENKSIITVFFDKEIFIIGGSYYFEIDSAKELNRYDEIIFSDEEAELQKGIFVSKLEENDLILISYNEKSIRINENDLRGSIFYTIENE
jgi:hypothetical protein